MIQTEFEKIEIQTEALLKAYQRLQKENQKLRKKQQRAKEKLQRLIIHLKSIENQP